jgi:hypothetical protein
MASREKKQPEIKDDSGKSEIMHRLKTHPFMFVGTVVILVIVIVAFVFVPALAPAGYRGEELIFGYYNKVPIKYVQNNYFHQAQMSLSQRYQISTDDPDYFKTIIAIWNGAFEETAVHMGIMDEMKQAGYLVPDDVVNREVAALPIFQENGRFSSTRYRALDNNTRLNIWRQVRDSLTKTCYTSDLERLKTSSKEAAFIGSMASPRRSFDLVIFPVSTYPDSEIIAFAGENPDLFSVIHLSRITVNSGEREARQILNNVKNGISSFEETAITNSNDMYAEKGGDMGIQMAHELAREISDERIRNSVINLTRGEMSDLVKLESGWAFFRAEESSYPVDVYDPLQREKIRSYIMNNIRGRVEDWLTSEAEVFSARAREIGFDAAVEAAYIEKFTFGPIPVNYGDTYLLFGTVRSAGIPELENAGTNTFFWRAAFSTPLNTVSAPVVVGNNVMLLYPLEETSAQEDEVQMIESYYPYWMGDSAEYSYRYYFLTNEKLDNRFAETFGKIWGPN